MAFAIGDKVKVVTCLDSTNGFIDLTVGTVSTISNIWDDAEFPYELDGFSECVSEGEIQLSA